MAWIMMAFFVLLITPVSVGIVFRWESDAPRGTVGVMVWGLRVQASILLGRNAEGKLLLTAAFRDKKLPLPHRKERKGKGIKMLSLMLKSDRKTNILRKAVRVNALDVSVRLGGQDAAALALGTGFFRSLNPLLPFLRLRCVPALGEKTALYARCIAEARLGILLTAWILVFGRKKEA